MGLGGKGSMMEGSDLPRGEWKEEIAFLWKGEIFMEWQHGEYPLEQEEELEHEEPGDLEDIVFELEGFCILEREPIVEPTREHVPMDDYLEKELERQREEELVEMLPERIP
jgi:hypothetical protein